MDIKVIIVIVFGVLLCIGGPILGHYASAASEKAEREEANRAKSK